MQLTDELILTYADKIYGFAYAKTHDHHIAEDLAQEILLQLCRRRADGVTDIEHMDAYIYRISCYTWANFLRKNKPAWEAVRGADDLAYVADEEDIAGDYERRELYERLRREVMYLSRTRRKITVMYYYDGLKGEEIAARLGIPTATVRWHMRETKQILKERLTMETTNGIYTPTRLAVGHNGWVCNYDMNGLVSDVIMQNICIICRDRPLTIEEIARTLGIAAVYLEDKIEKLLYMDYIRLVGANKYQTAFYIYTPEDDLFNAEFACKHMLDLAVPVWEIARAAIPYFRSEGMTDGEFSDDFLLYSLVMMVVNTIVQQFSQEANDRMGGLPYNYPLRKDGSEHFVGASFPWTQEKLDAISDPAVRDYITRGGGCGVKTRSRENMESLQFDQNEFGGWRDFDGEDLLALRRIHAIIRDGETPNDYDKILIATQVEKGYVRVDDGRPVLLIPYVSANALEALVADSVIMAHMVAERDKIDAVIDRLVEHRRTFAKRLPAYLDENERNYTIANRAGFGAHEIIYALHHAGYLYTPSEEEKKRICTIVFEG